MKAQEVITALVYCVFALLALTLTGLMLLLPPEAINVDLVYQGF